MVSYIFTEIELQFLGIDAESNIVKVFDDYYHHSLELTRDNHLWTTNVSCPVNTRINTKQ